jgi:hypothetical protein
LCLGGCCSPHTTTTTASQPCSDVASNSGSALVGDSYGCARCFRRGYASCAACCCWILIASRPMEQSLIDTASQSPVARPGSLSEHFFEGKRSSEEEVDDPELAKPAAAVDSKTSVFGSVMNLSNTILGAGALAMPFACAQTGIVLFVVLLLVVATGAHAAMRMLALCVDKHGMQDGRYASLGCKAFGKAGSTFATLAIALQQLGPCVIYIQICADILMPILCEVHPEIVQKDTSGCSDDSLLRIQLQLIVVVTLMLPLAMIKVSARSRG